MFVSPRFVVRCTGDDRRVIDQYVDRTQCALDIGEKAIDCSTVTDVAQSGVNFRSCVT